MRRIVDFKVDFRVSGKVWRLFSVRGFLSSIEILVLFVCFFLNGEWYFLLAFWGSLSALIVGAVENGGGARICSVEC